MQTQVQRQFEQFVSPIKFAAEANSHQHQFAHHCVKLAARLTALEEGHFATQDNIQPQQFSAKSSDQWVKIEAWLTALEAYQRNSPKKTAVVPTEDPVPYMLKDLPPYNDGNLNGSTISAM